MAPWAGMHILQGMRGIVHSTFGIALLTQIIVGAHGALEALSNKWGLLAAIASNSVMNWAIVATTSAPEPSTLMEGARLSHLHQRVSRIVHSFCFTLFAEVIVKAHGTLESGANNRSLLATIAGHSSVNVRRVIVVVVVIIVVIIIVVVAIAAGALRGLRSRGWIGFFAFNDIV